MRQNLSQWLRTGLCMAAVSAVGLSIAAAEEPATQPAAGEKMSVASPATKPTVSADAQSELDAITAAYGKLTSLDLAGTLSVQTDVDGQSHQDSSSFTSTFQSPVKFRHTMKDDLVVGCTGDKSYIFVPDKKMYVQADAPKSKADFTKSPTQASKALEQQNPSLYLALSDNAGQSLTQDATDVSKTAGEKIGEKNFSALSIKSKDNDITVLLDPDTHFVRQVRMDLSKELKTQGAGNVKLAMATFDYTSVVPNSAVKPEQFAWTPPEGTKDAAVAQKEMMADGASALVGKPVPDFSLAGVDDKTVTQKDLKGTVYILDFWATWCGPCRMSLPHLDKLYQDKQAAGLKVFAVNLQEDKPAVQDFVAKTKLSIPVLLDTEGKIAEAFAASAIPETVLVGKDGIIKKVLVGYDESDALQKAVDAELAAK